MNDHSPLAEKMRPNTLDEFLGQKHILGKDKILRRIIESDRIIPMIFWGPPGSGKTTLAQIISDKTESRFVSFSAVSSGVSDARKLIAEAREILDEKGTRTILFVDEIHRFNKSQQDLFLPYVEDGTIIMIGATTENPSFQVNAPLLSRARVFHFREHTIDDIVYLLKSAIDKINKNPSLYFPSLKLEKVKISIQKEAQDAIAKLCEGDGRDAYNALELAIISGKVTEKKLIIDKKLAEESIQQKFIRYDKDSDGHFDAISALHKSIRASDVDAALHYTARMLEAGEEPLYLLRRLIRCAAEDIGMADPEALKLAVATMQATHFIGMPESGVIIAELVVYLSLAPKSRKVNDAYDAAKNDVVNNRLDQIPLKIRNAPTKLMKEFGFGKNYKMYDKESCLPENLKGRRYWTT
jgi:putative ATPase